MLVVKIDGLDAEAAQAVLTSLPNIAGLAIHAANTRVLRITHNSELRGQHDLVALAPDRASHELLILMRTINIRRVEKSDSKLERPVDGCDGFVIVEPAVKFRHAHAPQALGRDFRTASSEVTHFHGWLLTEHNRMKRAAGIRCRGSNGAASIC